MKMSLFILNKKQQIGFFDKKKIYIYSGIFGYLFYFQKKNVF